MNQMLAAWQGRATPEMERVAADEGRPLEYIMQAVGNGTVVIPANTRRANLHAVGFGAGLRTKVNANIGTSSHSSSLDEELVKLETAVKAGADAVMDLSTGGDLDLVRQRILAGTDRPVGTVPIYQAAVEVKEKRGRIVDMTADDLFGVIERQARDGVDFMTVHCGVTLDTIEALKAQGRTTDIVSRGGSFLTGWMLHHERENPLYEDFERLLEICLEYDVTLSLGDGLRPGSIADATDRAQIQELLILGELVDICREFGVQAMVEGPGHLPLDQVIMNVQVQKRLCKGAPFYVLGPLVTDIAPGYDHITAAIGGAVAAMTGADFICYVTPAEHLGLPTVEHVRDGVVAARIAGHAADIVKNVPGARERDHAMSEARRALDWKRQIELAIDPEKAARYRRELNPEGTAACTMCGDFCAMRIVGKYLGRNDDPEC